MKTLTLHEKRKSPRVPVELTVLGKVEDRRIAMSSENISLDGMFLFSREFIRPCANFSARVWLSNEEEPLQTYLTSCFVEQTWAGYGIGVMISGISASDRALWEAFYHHTTTACAEKLRQQSEPTVRNRRVLVVDGALSPLAMQTLHKHGLAVSSTPSVSDALDLVQREPIDVVISDLTRPGLDGLALCCRINGDRLPTRTVLLTNAGTPKEYLLGLYAGATRVIAKPYSNDLLVSRILEVLAQPLTSGRALPGSSANRTVRRTGPVSRGQAAAVAASRGLSSRHLVDRASQCLGQVYRYVSDHLAHRQNA